MSGPSGTIHKPVMVEADHPPLNISEIAAHPRTHARTTQLPIRQQSEAPRLLFVYRRMHISITSQLHANPLNRQCRLRRAHEGVLPCLPAAYAPSTTHHKAGSQHQALCKPAWQAALNLSLHHKRIRNWTSAAAKGTCSCPDEAWSETLVVVEGLSDQRAIRKAVPAQVFVLHGASKSSVTATAQLLKQRADSCSCIIALLDPDVAGRQSRTVIDACLPGRCWHAFLPVWQATAPKDIRSKLAGDVGIEHGTPNQIRQALIAARPSCPGRKDFSRADLVSWGLLAEMGTDPGLQAGCVQRRAAFSAALGLGNCDGKQLLRQLNNYGFSRQHVRDALAVIALPDAASLAVHTVSPVLQ